MFDLYKPEVVVLQCGADAIVGDPLGGSNLIPDDLINCINFVLNYQLPCLLLGGGGYHFTNSSRYWCAVTASICQETLSDDIPADDEDFLQYGPDYSVTIKKEKFLKDLNTEENLDKQCRIIEGNGFAALNINSLNNHCLFPDNLKYYKVQAI